MTEKFEIHGYWFLPSNPVDRIAGILHYLPNEKIYLDLIGSFENPDETFVLDSDRIVEIIHGEGNNAEKITLLKCYQ